ncbi:MAG: RNA polymerase sigma factor [Agathobacter sp.]
MEDSDIIDLFLQKDEIAIVKTSEKYGSRLFKLANGILDDEYATQECENDTYLMAWNAIPPHEPRTYFFSFLAKITRHIALDRCKERSRIKRNGHLMELTQEMEQCIPGTLDVEHQIEARELGKNVSDFLRTKSKEARNIFIRRYWYMDSISDIAQRFGVSESKIKTQLFRSRKELKKYLEKEGYLI